MSTFEEPFSISPALPPWLLKIEAQWNGYRIFQLAGEGDSICVEAIDQMCDCLGKGISNICYVLNPQIVVLGGGIMAQEEYLRPRLEKALARLKF